MLDRYNHIDGAILQRGDVLLVPLTDLPLTDAGKQSARESEGTARSEVEGAAREAQRKVANEMPSLLAEQRGGRYLDAVVHANRMLSLGELTRGQMADIHRVLTEAYVALEATGLAAAACQRWRTSDPAVVLDPVMMSPKIIEACKAGEKLK